MKNKFKFMWLFVMFDLPVNSKQQQKDSQLFRTNLLKLGFNMLQYSIYYMPCNTLDNVDTIKRKVKSRMPEYGNINILYITEIQFQNMECFNSRKKKETEQFPQQLSFF